MKNTALNSPSPLPGAGYRRLYSGRQPRPLHGIGLMIIGTGFITLNDAMMKSVIVNIPMGEAIFVRGLFGLLVTAVLLHRVGGWPAARWRNFKGQLLASLLLVVPIYLFVYSLSRLSLGITTILLGTNPLMVVIFSAWLLREQVGWQRWAAVAVGFAGLAMVVRPADDGFSVILLLPVVVAMLGALRDLLIRRMVTHETPISIQIFSSVIVVLSTLPSAAFGWHTPSFSDLTQLAVSGAGFALGIFCLTDAMRFAPVSLLAAFKYSGVVWALMLSFLIWGETPTAWVLAGATTIVLSGLFVLRAKDKS